MRLGLVMFVIFGAFFELIFTAGKAITLRSVFFPAALILLGLYLLVSRSGLLKGGAMSETEDPVSSSKEES